MKLKKKILYVSTYALDSNDSASVRNRAMVKGLMELGFDVYTLTRKNNGKDSLGCVRQYFLNTPIIYERAHNISKENNRTFWKIKKVAWNLYSSFSIYDSQRALLKDMESIDIDNKSFDYIISSSDSKVSHLIIDKMLLNKQISARKWTQYWGDPFYNDINIRSWIPRVMIKKEEKRLLHLADYVFYTNPITLEEQKSLFEEEKQKMHFIPSPYIRERIGSKIQNEKKTIGYYGNYNSKDRDIRPLYNAAKELKTFNFEIIGDSDLKLEADDNIMIRNRLPYNQIEQVENNADLLICLGNKLGSSQLPGKFYNYAATDKPILFIYEQGCEKLAEYAEKLHRYYVCLNQKSDIIRAIISICNDDSVKYYPYTDFYCVNVAREFIEIIAE